MGPSRRQINFPVTGPAVSLTAGDFNNNGLLDIVAATSPGYTFLNH
jgi:hypothetical protein